MKRCPRCKQNLPLEAFGVNNALPDGRNVYDLVCNRERMAEARAMTRAGIVRQRQPKRNVEQTAADKVEMAISLGYGTWSKLRRSTGLTADEIGIALAELMFEKRSIRAKTINGERFFVRRAA